jgi:hypothetical protein
MNGQWGRFAEFSAMSQYVTENERLKEKRNLKPNAEMNPVMAENYCCYDLNIVS